MLRMTRFVTAQPPRNLSTMNIDIDALAEPKPSFPRPLR
jgi:hypothetical protein